MEFPKSELTSGDDEVVKRFEEEVSLSASLNAVTRAR
jgi:hypothetical protein